MINFVHSPPCGNAVYLQLRFAAAQSYRVLRRTDQAFSGPFDAGAVVVADAPFENVVDIDGLVNGTTYFYQAYLDGEPSGDPVAAIPAYLAEPLYEAPDVADLVRERLKLGLDAELLAGRLAHVDGRIPVLSATPPTDSVQMPMVAVTLLSRLPELRAVGEVAMSDTFDGAFWSAFEGWLDRSTIGIEVWATNHEDRRRLRNAVQRVLMLNLPVFAAQGLDLPELSESDNADFETYAVPMYRSVFRFTCIHAALVRSLHTPISEVSVNVNEIAG